MRRGSREGRRPRVETRVSTRGASGAVLVLLMVKLQSGGWCYLTLEAAAFWAVSIADCGDADPLMAFWNAPHICSEMIG